MAMFQPPEDAIQMVLEYTGFAVTRDSAIRRLKGNNNNPEQAVNEFFENPDSESKYKWDDSQFSSDRDGGGNRNNQSIPFIIHGADEHYKGPYDGGMSRPPSRTDHNKSPINKIIDLTAEHSMANANMSMSSQDQQDRELQQALAMSLEEIGLPPQEQGVTNMDEVAFGPANRNEYEQGKWEMVPAGKTSVQEIVVDPEPAERKRDLDAPAFLKPTVTNSRLNALITIFHEIPMIRNVFLNIRDCLPNYGTNKEWWSGEKITLPSMQVDDDPPIYDEIDRELQRLMAFLDKTERSYGSVDVLANLDEVKRMIRQNGPDVESAVLQAWKHIFEHSIYENYVKVIFSVGVASESSEDQPQEFAMLELSLPTKDSAQETLYDIADETLWSNQTWDLADTPYLFHIAEVIAFKIEGGSEHKRVDIPAVWYPDRYLKSSREAALEMQRKKRATAEKYERICKLEQQLTFVPLQSGKIVAVKDLFDASLKHDENQIQEDTVSADEDLMDVEPRPSKVATKLSEELRKVLESIDKKLTALSEAKESACQELRNLSKLYTEPSDETPPLHRYSLRGVSTSKHTMYICRRAEPDLMDMNLANDGLPTNGGDQWWRINYAPVGSSPVTVEKTTEEKVLEAAKNESNNTILVYASDKALDFPKHALPKALETFVRNDNVFFKSEFSASFSDTGDQSPFTVSGTTDSSQSIPSSPFSASSPGKRKYAEDEIMGRATTRRSTVSVSAREVESHDKEFDSEGTVMGGMPGGGASTSETETGSGMEEMIIGIDSSLTDVSNQNGAGLQGNKGGLSVNGGSGKSGGLEMQERSNMPMLTGRSLGSGNAAAIAASKAMGAGSGGSGSGMEMIDGMDMNMDLDQVVQRDGNVREESAAVRRVAFK